MNPDRLEQLFQTLGIIWRTLLVLLVVGGSFVLLRYTIPLIYPFIIAWLIALAIEPFVRFLEKRCHIPRWGGTTLSLLFFLGALSALITVAVIRIVNESTRLVQFIQANINTFSASVADWFSNRASAFTQLEQAIEHSLKQLQHLTGGTQAVPIADSVQKSLQSLAEFITGLITAFISFLGSFLGNLPFILTVLVVISLGSFFISKNWPKLHAHGRRLLPNVVQDSGGAVITDLKKALVGFVRAQLTLVTLTAIIVLVGLMVLQVNYALTLALIIGFVDLLPYIGVGAVMIPWVIYLFIAGNYSLAIGLSVLYTVIIVVRQLLEPKVYASNIGLDPLVTLLAIFVGLQLFGVLGLIIGPTAMVILNALYRARVFHDTFAYIAGDKKT
ncbi:sporulation integral membrane protein YtvI [Numidum massiliense]|uniref:sporulation integral membrane protein YtvI n=1 Tax=Numidum massiliense TaxID=1522315 RepID=UPI0006D58BE8|nr:sporulation integral membrane protein YtvI [Numidum massiliense]